MRKARRAAARRGRRLRIMFADEARFGRINRPRPCGLQPAPGPRSPCQLIREYISLYGAVAPKDGTCVYMIMPISNTACFQAFLNILARKFAQADLLFVLDGAPNHRCRRPRASQQYLLALPAALFAELNPKENTLGRNPREYIQELRTQIHRRRACQTQTGHPLYRTQSKNRQIHHVLPLHQVTLMWKWYY